MVGTKTVFEAKTRISMRVFSNHSIIFIKACDRNNTERKLGFVNTWENTKRKLYKVKKGKIEISLESVKICNARASNLRPSELESHALTSRPRTLNNRQTPATK